MSFLVASSHLRAAIFRGYRGLVNPGLQALEGFIVVLFDFGEDWIEVRRACRVCPPRQG